MIKQINVQLTFNLYTFNSLQSKPSESFLRKCAGFVNQFSGFSLLECIFKLASQWSWRFSEIWVEVEGAKHTSWQMLIAKTKLICTALFSCSSFSGLVGFWPKHNFGAKSSAHTRADLSPTLFLGFSTSAQGNQYLFFVAARSQLEVSLWEILSVST